MKFLPFLFSAPKPCLISSDLVKSCFLFWLKLVWSHIGFEESAHGSVIHSIAKRYWQCKLRVIELMRRMRIKVLEDFHIFFSFSICSQDILLSRFIFRSLQLHTSDGTMLTKHRSVLSKRRLSAPKYKWRMNEWSYLSKNDIKHADMARGMKNTFITHIFGVWDADM